MGIQKRRRDATPAAMYGDEKRIKHL